MTRRPTSVPALPSALARLASALDLVAAHVLEALDLGAREAQRRPAQAELGDKGQGLESARVYPAVDGHAGYAQFAGHICRVHNLFLFLAAIISTHIRIITRKHTNTITIHTCIIRDTVLQCY
jgi:hypothetical protein